MGLFFARELTHLRGVPNSTPTMLEYFYQHFVFLSFENSLKGAAIGALAGAALGSIYHFVDKQQVLKNSKQKVTNKNKKSQRRNR